MKKRYKILFITACLTFLQACPVTIKVALKNEAKKPISVIYSTGFKSEIEPEKTKKEHYNLDCIRIKIGENIFEYRTVMPPKKYFSHGVFSTSFNAVFTDDYRVRVYDKDSQDDFIELEQGC